MRRGPSEEAEEEVVVVGDDDGSTAEAEEDELFAMAAYSGLGRTVPVPSANEAPNCGSLSMPPSDPWLPLAAPVSREEVTASDPVSAEPVAPTRCRSVLEPVGVGTTRVKPTLEPEPEPEPVSDDEEEDEDVDASMVGEGTRKEAAALDATMPAEMDSAPAILTDRDGADDEEEEEEEKEDEDEDEEAEEIEEMEDVPVWKAPLTPPIPATTDDEFFRLECRCDPIACEI